MSLRIRWIPITPQAYSALFGAFPEGHWHCFSSYTRPRDDAGRYDGTGEYIPGDQRTEWGLQGQDFALLANQTDDGKHTYYIAQAVDDA